MKNAARNLLRYGAHASAWVGLFLVYALVFRSFYPWDVVITRTVVNVVPLAFLFYANGWWLNLCWKRGRVGLYLLGALALFLLLAFLRVRLNLLFPDVSVEWRPMDARTSYQIGAFATNAAILAVSAFFQLWFREQEREKQQQAFLNEQQNAQLQFLKAQINPHFLFNTLNNIYALAVLGSERTPEMIQKLSELLRYVIYESQAGQVSLEKELDYVNRFIELFQMRSEEPLQIKFRLEGEPAGKEVEPMVLIPLVENCLKHCDFDINPGAFVDIRVKAGAEFLEMETENTVNREDRQKDQTGGVGLENIRKRLELKFPGAFSLRTAEGNGRFSVFLSIPYESHPRTTG